MQDIGAPPPPFAIPKVKKKWKDPLEKKVIINFEKSKPRSLENIQWKKLCGIQKSTSGSGGVWFVDIPETDNDKKEEQHQLIVIKSSPSIAADLFTFYLAEHLEVNIPKFRLLTPDTEELYQATLHCLQRLTIQVNGKLPEGKDANNLSMLMVLGGTTAGAGNLNRPFYLLLEYIPHIDGENLAQNEKFIQEKIISSPLFSNYLRQIGRILALDCIVNNFDRIPLKCLWKYEFEQGENIGNLGNLLFCSSNGSPVAIDQSITSIDPDLLSNKFEEYAFSLKELVHQCRLSLSDNKVAPKFMEIEDTLKRLFGISLGCEFVLEVQRGFVNAIDAACNLNESDLQFIYDKVYALFASVIENYPDMAERTVGLHSIHLPYLTLLLEKIIN